MRFSNSILVAIVYFVLVSAGPLSDGEAIASLSKRQLSATPCPFDDFNFNDVVDHNAFAIFLSFAANVFKDVDLYLPWFDCFKGKVRT